jgi:hypothetical protein
LDFLFANILTAVSHVNSNVPFSCALFTRLFHFNAYENVQLLSLT